MSFPLINPSHQFFDTSGAPLVSGTVEFQNPTTSAKINTYPTADDADAQTNANANPFTLDSRGGYTGIYLEDGVKYKMILKDSAGATVDTQDDVLCPIALPYQKTAAETAAGVTIVNIEYPPGNVLRYGTNTVPGTTDMSTAIQAAADTAENVYLPRGTYLIASSITLTRDLYIRGDGGASIKGSAGTEQIIATGYSMYADGITFDTLGAACYNAGTITTLDIRNCIFNTVTEIYKTSAATNTQTNVIFLDNKCNACGRGLFVKLNNISYALVRGNRFTSFTSALDQVAAIRLGNDVDSATYPATRRNFTVTDNHIDSIATTATSTRSWGIAVFGDHVIVSDNYVKDITVGDSNGAEGIYVKSRYASVTGNVCVDAADSSAQAAITIKGDTSSTRGSHVTVSNNSVYSDGTPSMYGIWTEVDSCVISDNAITGTSLGGIGTGQRTMSNLNIHDNKISTTGRFGINVNADGENICIHSNTIDGVTDAGANASSYGIIVQSQASTIDRLKIYDNTVDIDSTSTSGTVGGIAVTQTAKAMTDVEIYNNICTVPTSLTPSAKGIMIQGVADIITRLSLKNNVVDDSDEGIDLQVSVKGLFMSGNKLEKISTTDATVTTTFRIPISDESLYQIEARILGKEDNTEERGMYSVAGLFYRDAAGNATLQGALATPYTVEVTGSMTGTLAVSGGSDVLARVTGVAASNIEWLTDINIQSI
jgi:hypothetical protein